MNKSDVLIIGGGAIGLATALELALRGISVTVLSRNFQEAALHAAAGMLAPQAEGLLPGPMLELCLRSRNLYAEWTQKLESLTGLDPEYWPCGILAPQYDSEPMSPQSSGWSERSQRLWCDRSFLAALQPGLSNQVIGGWWFPHDGQVNNQALAEVLRAAIESVGVKVLDGATVEQILHSEVQVTGVQTADGLYQAGQYVLASGAWAGQMLPIPVVPRKGQMLSIQAGPHCPLQHVLFGRDVYIVPRRSGRIVVGATVEAVGFNPHNTPAGIQQILSAATRLFPPLKDWALERCWWGFRPATPDELPILGPGPYKNLTLATGHYRNGILLTPITAQLTADWVAKQRLDPLLKSFCWERFQESQGSHGI
jgi:glycine oxidase